MVKQFSVTGEGFLKEGACAGGFEFIWIGDKKFSAFTIVEAMEKGGFLRSKHFTRIRARVQPEAFGPRFPYMANHYLCDVLAMGSLPDETQYIVVACPDLDITNHLVLLGSSFFLGFEVAP